MLALKPLAKRSSALLPTMGPIFRWMPQEFRPILDTFFTEWPALEIEELTDRYPLTLEEKEKEVVVRAELPGFAPDEVKVEVNGELLKVEAEHKEPKVENVEKKEVEVKEGEKKEEKGEKKIASKYARVERMITLPPEAEVEKAEAVYRHGVLEIRLPKKAEALPRRIEVKV